MTHKLEETWLVQEGGEDTDTMMETYFNDYRKYVMSLSSHLKRKECLSGTNRMLRRAMWSATEMQISISMGDICYIEYGQAFINEAGYQHFGLVIGMFNHKIFVVPMTSNREMILSARNVATSLENQKEHLYYIGQLPGLNKPSVLFLNDAKFINSSRVISVNAQIDTDSVMFKEIRKYVMEMIMM